MDANPEVVALIMAGGSGTRFWPLSRKDLPKQYLSLTGQQSLIQETVARLDSIVLPKNFYICSNVSQEKILKAQLPQVSHLILEPAARNTAPCLALSLVALLRAGHRPDTVMMVLPADHSVQNVPAFQDTLKTAIAFAAKSKGLVTLGIVPDSPHTGYGYIEAGESVGSQALKVLRFVEKPDLARAKTFLEQKNFFWNSGVFVWTLGALREAFQTHTPEMWRRLWEHKPSELSHIYPSLESIPIDIAVLEKARNVSVIPSDFGWSDIGSWDALYRLKAEEKEEQVVLSGRVESIESKGCLVYLANGKKLALVGVEDLIVVENGDTLLIAHRSKDQLVREASQAFDN